MPAEDLKARAFALSERALDVCERMALDGPRMAHIADQLFRAVSAIGALLEEGEVANSRRDMAAKYAIALPSSFPSSLPSSLPLPFSLQTFQFPLLLACSTRISSLALA